MTSYRLCLSSTSKWPGALSWTMRLHCLIAPAAHVAEVPDVAAALRTNLGPYCGSEQVAEGMQ